MKRSPSAASPIARPDALAASLARGGGPAHAAFAALTRHADALGDDAHDYARALPRGLHGLAPEHQRAVARLWIRLDARGAGLTLPAWRDVVTEPAARVAWWHAELLTTPDALDAHAPSPELRHAVATLPTERLDAPIPLIDALLRHVEPACATRALALLDEAVANSTLPLDAIHERLCALAAHPDRSLRAAALQRLAAPWASNRARPSLVADGLRDDATRLAALACAASWRLEGPLRGALAAKGELPVATSLDALAHVVAPSSVGAVIAQTCAHGAWIAPALLRFVLALHQRGVFVREDSLDALLDVLAQGDWDDLDRWAMALYTLRDAVLDRLAACDPDVSHAPGLGALALALGRVAPAAYGDRAVEHVERLLAATTDEGVAAAVVPLLARCARPSSEAVLLRWLPTLGAECLPAVIACGGDASVEALARGLGLDADVPIAPWAAAAPDAVAEALYRLVAHDPERRDALLQRAELRRFATVRAWYAAAPPPAPLAALAPSSGRLPTAARIALLAEGSSHQLPALDALLATHLHEVVSTHLAGRRPERETVVAPEVRQSLAAMTRRLRAAGHARPRFLVTDPSDDAVAAELLLAQLGRTEHDAVRAAIVRTLGALTSVRVAPALVSWIHAPAVAVRTAAIRALTEGRGEAVTLHLVRALASPDIEVARAALEGLLAQRTRVAARAVTALLEHPNMNVKKAAASALGALGDRASVGPIVGWLGRHDNPGLRASLLASLDALLGAAATAPLLAALDDAATADERALLLAALDGRLSVRAARAHRDAPWFGELTRALRDGAVALRDATARDLAALLGDAPAVTARAPSDDLDRWITRGIPHTDVARVAAAWRARELPSDRALPLVRRDTAVLLGALDDAPVSLRDDIVTLLAEAFASVSDRDALRPLTPSVGRVAAVPPGADRSAHRRLLRAMLPALDDAARWELAARWRSLDPAPDADAADSLDLLRACGAIVTRADLDVLLAPVSRTAAPADVAVALVARALGVSLPLPDRALVARVHDAVLVGDVARALVLEDDDPLAVVAALARELPWLEGDARAALLDGLLSLRPLDVSDWRGGPARAVRPARQRPTTSVSSALRTVAQRPDAVREMRAGTRPVERSPWVLPLWIGADTGGSAWLAALADDTADAVARHDLARLGDVRARLQRLDAAIVLGEARLRLWRPLVDALVAIWTLAPPTHRDDAGRLLARCPPSMLATLLTPAIAAGHWGLFAHLRAVAADAPLAALLARAKEAGYGGPIPSVVDGALQGDEAPAPTPVTVTVAVRPPREVLDGLEGHDAELVRRALKELAREGAAAVRPYLDRALADPRPRVSDLAARMLRTQGTRAEHLAQARERLCDPRVAVRVSAIRSLSHAQDAEALPAIVALLLAPENAVRHAARAGLRRYGEAAWKCLDEVARRERPDRARRLTAEREALATN
jgi:HEAT repeat protein